jgi:hypothetical protein
MRFQVAVLFNHLSLSMFSDLRITTENYFTICFPVVPTIRTFHKDAQCACSALRMVPESAEPYKKCSAWPTISQ